MKTGVAIMLDIAVDPSLIVITVTSNYIYWETDPMIPQCSELYECLRRRSTTWVALEQMVHYIRGIWKVDTQFPPRGSSEKERTRITGRNIY